MTRVALVGLLGAVAIAGCGSYPAPTEKLANTTANVRAAEEIGAARDAKAALHLQLAKEELDKAKALMKDGDNKRAEYTLMRADADAELASALARESSMRAEADKAREDVRALKKGM